MKNKTKNDAEATAKKLTDKKREAEKAKKMKKREAAKAKRLKLIEKRKAKVEANKKKRAEKKAKKLARLEKIKAKKLAAKAKKQAIRQKKLERLAKQKAKAKELKLKAKAKAQKAKVEKPAKQAPDSINITVKLLKDYVKALAKDVAGLDDKKIKKLEALGFSFNEEDVTFSFTAKRKVKKQVKPEVVEELEVVEPETPADETIDAAIETVIGDKSDAIEALAKELESDDEDKGGTEVPVGDTFTDNVNVDNADAESDDFPDDGEDDTIDDYRDEDDDDKVDFRRDWNNEFDDNGERNEDW